LIFQVWKAFRFDALSRRPCASNRSAPASVAGPVCSSGSSAKWLVGSHAPTGDGFTVRQVPFENDDAIDRRVDDLLVAIALIAEQHRCTSESDAWAEVAGQTWRW
jgi:hypothetical protein